MRLKLDENLPANLAPHCGLLLVRLRHPSRSGLSLRLLQVFQEEPVETWHRCVVVIADQKVRVRRPPTS